LGETPRRPKEQPRPPQATALIPDMEDLDAVAPTAGGTSQRGRSVASNAFSRDAPAQPQINNGQQTDAALIRPSPDRGDAIPAFNMCRTAAQSSMLAPTALIRPSPDPGDATPAFNMSRPATMQAIPATKYSKSSASHFDSLRPTENPCVLADPTIGQQHTDIPAHTFSGIERKNLNNEYRKRILKTSDHPAPRRAPRNHSGGEDGRMVDGARGVSSSSGGEGRRETSGGLDAAINRLLGK
jgi:hypothetical protein